MSLKERLAGLAKRLRSGGKVAVVKAATPAVPAVGGGKMPEGTARVTEKAGTFPGKAEAPKGEAAGMPEAAVAGRSLGSARATVKPFGEMPRGSGEGQMATGVFPAAAVPKNVSKGEFPGSSARMPREGQAPQWETTGTAEFGGVVGLAGPGEDPARGLSELLRVQRRMGPTAATYGEEVL